MIRLLIFRLWPALIPFVIYFAWLYWRKKKLDEGETLPAGLARGGFFWTIVASFVLLVASFMYYGFSQPAGGTGVYVPAHYKDGKLTPSHIIPEDPTP